MARLPRHEQINEYEVGIYHCWNGCVQQRWLLGRERRSGRDHRHRKSWVEAELKRLARGFAIDVVSFAVMSNHFHVILRNRPDLVCNYSDEEVIRRWWMICPGRRRADGTAAQIEDTYIAAQLLDEDRLQEMRRRLSSISWLLRLWTYRIARRANREAGKRGHFWEGRFSSRRLVDEGSLLMCMGYVELNPIRAGIAETLERSRYTSVFLRIQARAISNRDAGEMSDGGLREGKLYLSDAWLAPLHLSEGAGLGGEPAEWGAPRASNKGLLPITLDQYLGLLDWNARQLRSNKSGATPDHLAALWERLGLAGDAWPETIKDFDERIRHWLANPDELAEEARKLTGKRSRDTRFGRRPFRC